MQTPNVLLHNTPAWKSRWTSWAPVPNKPMVSVNIKQHFNKPLLYLQTPNVLLQAPVVLADTYCTATSPCCTCRHLMYCYKPLLYLQTLLLYLQTPKVPLQGPFCSSLRQDWALLLFCFTLFSSWKTTLPKKKHVLLTFLVKTWSWQTIACTSKTTKVTITCSFAILSAKPRRKSECVQSEFHFRIHKKPKRPIQMRVFQDEYDHRF